MPTLETTAGRMQLTATATIEAAKADGKLPSFDIHGYTGAPMRLAGWRHPVILDLAGGRVERADIPALKAHDDNHVVGHSTAVTIDASGVRIQGVVSGTGPAAMEVVANSKNGFGWQASVGADPGRHELLAVGKNASVNGRNIEGPAHIVREWTISEISFVPRGADSATSAAIAAKDSAMSIELDQDPDTLEATRLKGIHAAFVAGAKSLAANGKDPEALMARAIDEDWTVQRAELEVVRAARPTLQQHNGGSVKAVNNTAVLEAALCQTLSVPNLDKKFDDQTLQAAHTAFHGRLGLQQLLIMGASANGYVTSPGSRITQGSLREILAYNSRPQGGIMASGFSTFSGTNLLSTVANRVATAGYEEADQTWREVARIASVPDFRTTTTYRLLDDMDYDELPPDGEFKHATIEGETYDRRAKTYGRMFALTRTDIINDDLNLFDTLRRRLGLAAGVKISDVVWAAFMVNSGFFTVGHGNYDEDVDTALATDGAALQLAETLFSKLKSPDGKIIGGDATKLIHPPELAVKARMLYGTTNAGAVIADDTISTAFRGLYRPVKQARLSDTTYTGNSATAWYLLRDPSLAAVVVASFLNGRQAPIVEQAETDFNTLGIQMRGYHDFGADLTNEYVAGVKMEGVNV